MSTVNTSDKQPEKKWFGETGESTLAFFGSTWNGLSTDEARNRFEIYGPNSLKIAKPRSRVAVFFSQFASPLIYILLVAGIIVGILGNTEDAVIIFIVLLLNALVGTYQEGKAEDTLSALGSLTATEAEVVRNGVEEIISDREVVPGDIILVTEGNKVPADARLIETSSLAVDESALTGEAESVEKDDQIILSGEPSEADQLNMVFKGTFVTRGRGRAIVVATGKNSVVGKISEALVLIDTDVPLKKNIKKLSTIIITAIGIISVAIFLLGISAQKGALEMFSIVVALAVSAIPEGLPVVVTLVLALGVWRMSKQRVLVKRLQAVEALGQASVIALDKTGTVTRNEMMVEKLYTASGTYDVVGKGYEAKGSLFQNGESIVAPDHADLMAAGRSAVLVSSARVFFHEKEGIWRVSGDPTEASLLVFGEKLGFHRDDIEKEYPRVREIPFSSDIKMRAVINREKGTNILRVVGAPEVVLPVANRVFDGTGVSEINELKKKEIAAAVASMSHAGLRVVVCAESHSVSDAIDPKNLPPLELVAIFGIADAIRSEVPAALRSAREAGIAVVMITGDHKVTAMSIARKVGIMEQESEIITGEEIRALKEAEFLKRIPSLKVYARITPELKLSIIESYKKLGHTIAMTGDGVNDALSLVAADLGVSMGKIGSEVAKDASDIILLDDNFGGIVSAIKEGRNIYKSIQRVLFYLLSTNTGEVLVILAALSVGLSIPLLPSQIIWLNMVTDGFLVVALAMEPRSQNLSKYVGHAELVTKKMLLRVLIIGTVMMCVTMLIFSWYIDQGFLKASTVALTTLAVLQWLNALNSRSATRSVFSVPLKNPYLFGAFLAVILLQILAVYTPILQSVLHTVSLGIYDWFLIISMSLSVIVADEALKLFRRIRAKRIPGEINSTYESS